MHLFNANIKDRFLMTKLDYMSHVVRKPVFGISDWVQHKPGCTAIGLKFWIYVV